MMLPHLEYVLLTITVILILCSVGVDATLDAFTENGAEGFRPKSLNTTAQGIAPSDRLMPSDHPLTLTTTIQGFTLWDSRQTTPMMR